ncbi:hypothetical protein AB0C93_33660 [Streptomyces sp. NPDC048518]|uniref:hypothetical protein n=1 Tax=Streptomyces sp. NPDC048518 TaxID=3155029 RepID=UPI0033E86027
MSRRAARWVPALAFGALWWWGVLRVAFVPDAGVLEGAVAAGGWGLSVLPVHCVSKARAAGVAGGGGGEGDGGGEVEGEGPVRRSGGFLGRLRGRVLGVWERTRAGARVGVTKAWQRRRSGGGSGPS